jgi:hypothetical protein
MDPGTVFDRADVTEYPGDISPGGSDEPTWVAEDPETGCRGVRRFDEEARTHLVYAVEAYRAASDGDLPSVSFLKGRLSR